MQHARIKAAVIGAAAIGTLALGAAGFAPAASAASAPPITGSVNVETTLTITLSTPASFTFPATTPGSSTTATGAIVYSAASTDPAGVTATETATNFSDGAGDSIPAADMSGNGRGVVDGGTPFFPTWTDSTAGVTTWNTMGLTSDATFAENLVLAIPAGQVPGEYTTTVTETIAAN